MQSEIDWYMNKKWQKKKTSSDCEVSKKLATLVEGDQKAPFSITATPMFREGMLLLPLIAPLYCRSLPYNTEC